MQLSCAKIFRSCHMKVRKLMHQIGLLYHLYYLEEGTFCPFRTFSGGRHFLLPFRTHWSKTVIDKERMVKNVTDDTKRQITLVQKHNCCGAQNDLLDS